MAEQKYDGRYMVARKVREFAILNNVADAEGAKNASNLLKEDEWRGEPLRESDIEVYDIGPKTKQYVTPEADDFGAYEPIPIHGVGRWLLLTEAPSDSEFFWRDEDGVRWDYHDPDLDTEDEFDEQHLRCMVGERNLVYREGYYVRDTDGATVAESEILLLD